jgi:hexosaminidase
MRYYFIALLTIATFANAAAKPVEGPTFNAHDLSITWEAIQNDYKTHDQSLNAITITNNGKTTFPATGWKMYFN